ncbi:MotA/TolQ/ExbB proton channel family protein [Crocinitomicaceae bacterium]|jgi:biopolymer transport protein ExbB|nr:MotA/TolQ/ExbB proton channel family protein [Flavobacteriales bacterium]MDA8910663.1 MotA/TolQ/ExbB proton channel family protein [Crocinitomicaceae bacterium]MDA9020550.1 MotA/TolQ/ExbB proton channel family protein [bacterium]MBT5932747.1 MotA/TolQ/ExbB proton channel family protein [Flavobacteriales bacterium]MDA9161494.1 MotA/TolQ/ExbB proton channel family protein [Crocinitomicaceae bacterium]
MNNLFFLAKDTKETTKTFWEVFVNTDELVGLSINIILLLVLGYVVYIFVTKYLDYNSILKSYGNINKKIEEEYDSMMLSKYENSTNPFKKLISKYIDTTKQGSKKSTAESQLKNQGDFEMARLGEKVGVLATCSGVAPMIGFLGTTIGMVEVFMALEASKSLEISMISGGILTAMTTTVSGLVVGIVAYVGYNHLVMKLEKIAIEMENVSFNLMKNYDNKKEN